MCRAHGQPSSHATALCVLAFVLVERDPVQARQLLDMASEIVAPVRDRFAPLRIQLIRARVDIELARSSAGTIAASAVSKVFDELARTSDLASRWQLFAINVLRSARGTGLADLMMAELVGSRAVYLWVLPGNERARACYTRYGFVTDGGSMPFPPADQNAIRMSRPDQA